MFPTPPINSTAQFINHGDLWASISVVPSRGSYWSVYGKSVLSCSFFIFFTFYFLIPLLTVQRGEKRGSCWGMCMQIGGWGRPMLPTYHALTPICPSTRSTMAVGAFIMYIVCLGKFWKWIDFGEMEWTKRIWVWEYRKSKGCWDWKYMRMVSNRLVFFERSSVVVSVR